MNFNKKNGFRLLGLGKQEFIKYFFGGNASLAVFMLILICVFLIKEGWLFFPGHHKQLQTYRKVGLEYSTWVEEAYRAYKLGTGSLNRAYQAELAYPNRDNQAKISAYEATRMLVERELGDSLLVLRDAINQRKNESDPESDHARKLDAVIAKLKAQIEGERPELRRKMNPRKFLGIPFPGLSQAALKSLDLGEREKIINAVVELNFWEPGESSYYKEIKQKYDEVLKAASVVTGPLFNIVNSFEVEIAKPLEAIWQEASVHSSSIRDRANSNEMVSREIEDQISVALASNELSVRQTKYGAVLSVIVGAEFLDEYARIFYLFRFTEALFALKPDGAAYDELPAAIREKVEGILNGITGNYAEFVEVLRTGGDELDAFPKAVPEGSMDPDMRRMLFDLTRIENGTDKMIQELANQAVNFLNPFPFDKEARKLYNLTDQFNSAVNEIKKKGRIAMEQLPDPGSLNTQVARDEITKFRIIFEEDVKTIEEMGKKLAGWKFDKPWKWSETLGAFFLGTNWTTNSQIQDRYGIVPMLTGSLIITLIALTLAVPIAVSAAVYVNQFASFEEQRLLKPTIEFIGAIPSIVLGVLGIVVVGGLIQSASNWELLSWLPGFPIEARLNMLTAGLILAFMAIPIIFTLAEDALNHVPSAYRDCAFSLGATRFQTVFRVILPASLSGVIAATLLGFGRVIGETMVVLLVAGNRIAIPDFSKGFGVITEPSHTMTGIIAQGLGEAPIDSVAYRALFMVGLVLLLITLLINFVSQKILKKYYSHG